MYPSRRDATVRAIAAQWMGPGVHPAYPNGHPTHVPGATREALFRFVQEDWRPTNPALKDGGDDGKTIGAVEFLAAPQAQQAR
jgi:hypothetical protein